MQPVGLTTKRGQNKYARERDGEMMIVHQCTGCETVVINRIAADDSAAAINEIFTESWRIDPAARAVLANNGVSMLTADDRDLVRRRLFGDSPVGSPDMLPVPY
jgi:hypothetical protein